MILRPRWCEGIRAPIRFSTTALALTGLLLGVLPGQGVAAARPSAQKLCHYQDEHTSVTYRISVASSSDPCPSPARGSSAQTAASCISSTRNIEILGWRAVASVEWCWQTPKALFIFQADGNLVVYDERGRARWASHTEGRGGLVQFQDNDGNLVVYPPGGGRALWASNTCCRPNAFLAVQTDGNVVIYDGGRAIWATHTEH